MSSSLPKTYKAAVLEKYGQPLVLKDVPLKQPGPDEILVKVLACGVCGTDGHLCTTGLGYEQLPLVPGHEVVGDVVAVGDHVTSAKVGDRVGGAWHGGHDNNCRACSRGVFQMCEHEAINGVTRDGGWAEYALLRPEAAVHLSKDVDPVEVAPLLCAGVTTFNGLRKLHIEQGNLVAVQGLGALGHLAVQYARNMGYEVAVISSGPAKKDFAHQLGADIYIDASAEEPAQALAKRGGAAAIIVTAPNPKAIGPLLGGLQELGTLLVLSPVGEVTLNLNYTIGKGSRVAGWPSGHQQDSVEAIAFAKQRGVKAHIERFPFADVQKAFDRMQSGHARFKVVLDMQK